MHLLLFNCFYLSRFVVFVFFLGTCHRFKTVTGIVSVLFYLWREQQVCLHHLCPSEVLPDLKGTDEHHLLSVFIDMVYVNVCTLTNLLLSHIKLTHGFHLQQDRRRKKEKENIITTSHRHLAVWCCSQRRGFPVSLDRLATDGTKKTRVCRLKCQRWTKIN